MSWYQELNRYQWVKMETSAFLDNVFPFWDWSHHPAHLLPPDLPCRLDRARA